MLDRFAIAKILRQIAALLELKESNPYKIRAYQQGAHVLEVTDRDVEQLYREHNLEEIGGIGHALAAIIEELYNTGKSELLDKLQTEMPSVAIELAGIEGLNLKKIQKLQESLGISTRAELLQACQNNLLSKVPGLGKSLEQKLLSKLTASPDAPKIILAKALNLSQRLVKYLKKQALKAKVAGEVRRWQEVIEIIDLVVSTDNLAKTKKHFELFSSFVKCEWLDESTGIGYLANQLKVRITITVAEDFVFKLHEMTGSISHLKHLNDIASQKKISLYSKDSAAVADDDETMESDIYIRLGLPYIPPELREDWGEIEEAQAGDTFEDLIKEADIQGMVHCHSNYSDGNTSIEKMALAVQEMGYSYITITDHSPTAFYANGVDTERLKDQWAEIKEIQKKVKVKILRGTESDIVASGQLDYPTKTLEKFDVIIGSIHSRYKMNEEQMTQRIRTCMELPIFKIWGHALGRILLSRDPVPCRIEEILEVAARSPVAIEINGDPHRMDLEPFWLRQARKLGIKFVISTDAHATSDLLNLPFGIHMARRAGIRKADVLNTLPYAQFKKAVQPKQ